MARRRYGTFTPARREALRKAQLASAAKRRAMGRRATVKRYAKRTAVGVGVVGAVAGAAYGGHRAAGNKLIIARGLSPAPGEARYRATHYGTGSVSVARTNRKGKQTVALYARGVRHAGVNGKKIGGGPRTVRQYKPTKADIRNMNRYNSPVRHTTHYARAAMTQTHSNLNQNYAKRNIESGEALRRTRAYVQGMESKGKKISAAHHMAAAKHFANQPRYPGGTVKPLKRQSRRRFRRTYAKQNAFVNPRVLGSRVRSK